MPSNEIKRQARRRAKFMQNAQNLPPYWRLLQIGGAVIVGVGMLFAFGNDSAPVTVSPPDIGIVDPGTTPNPDPTTGPTGETLEVASLSGTGTVRVPADAVETARRAVTALYTGDFTGVQLAANVSAPIVANRWPSASASGPTGAASTSATLYRIQFKVDLAGSGAATEPVSVAVTVQDGRWVYLP
jgi:hypothetical protein